MYSSQLPLSERWGTSWTWREPTPTAVVFKMTSEAPLSAVLSPPGQHLHCGLWRRLSRDHPGPCFCFHLHRLWDHPEWPAHIHPLQQVFRLLLQTQVQSVHSCPDKTREDPIRQEDHSKAQPLLWKSLMIDTHAHTEPNK